MEIKKSELLTAMKKCLPGVEMGTTFIEGADAFIFTKNIIFSYNDSISITTPNPYKDLIGTVKSIDFYNIIDKLKEEKIILTTKENKWILKNGKTKAKISLLEENISQYIPTKIKKVGKYKLPKDFNEALSICNISSNPSYFSGVFIQDNLMMSSDSRRINYYKFKEKLESIYISNDSAGHLIKFPKVTTYSVDDEWVYFFTEDKTIFSCRLQNQDGYPIAAFMQRKKAVKKEANDLSNVLPEALLETIDRISTLAQDFEGNDAIKLSFSKDKLNVSSSRTSGSIEENISFEKAFKKAVDLPVWIDVPFLREALKKAPEFYIKQLTVKDDNGEDIEMPSIVFENKNYMQIVATMSE